MLTEKDKIEIKKPQYLIFVEIDDNRAAELLLSDEQRELIAMFINGVCDYNLNCGPELHVEKWRCENGTDRKG